MVDLKDIHIRYTNKDRTKAVATYNVPILTLNPESLNMNDVEEALLIEKWIYDKSIKIDLHLIKRYGKLEIRKSKMHQIRKQIADNYGLELSDIDLGSPYNGFGYMTKKMVDGVDVQFDYIRNVKIEKTRAQLRKGKIKNLFEDEKV